jgi:hypothetical protein
MATRQFVLNNLTDKVVAPPAQFLNTLSNWATSPAHQFLWVAHFSLPVPPGEVYSSQLPIGLFHGMVAVREAHSKDQWNMMFDAQHLATDKNFIHAGGSLNGCMVIQGVNLPGEQISHAYASVENRGGLIPILYSNERLEPQEMTMSIYEGNTSFLDTIIRQWIILTGHSGLVARPFTSMANVKCNITVTQFAKTVGREVTEDIAGRYVSNIPNDLAGRWQRDALGREFGGVLPTNTKLVPLEGTDESISGLVIRKQITYFNACPIRMEASDLTYSDDGGVMSKNVTFAYTHYGVRNFTTDNKNKNSILVSHMLGEYYRTGINNHWSLIRALYDEKWNALGEKFPLGAKWRRPSADVYGKVPSNTLGTDNSLTLKELKDRWQMNQLRLEARADPSTQYNPGSRRDGQFGKGIKLYGPKGSGYRLSFPEPGAQFFERWRTIKAKNLCIDPTNPRRNVCMPEGPPPGSALSRIRNSLRNLTKLARNARGLAASFKRIGKAKGVRGKLGALGDLNKSFKTLGGGDRSGKGPAKRGDGSVMGGGMPKAKSPGKTTTGISGAISVVDDAKKAARAITGKSRAKGGH